MEVTIENLKIELAKSFKGDLQSINPDTLLKDVIDSLDMLDFYMNLEETYDIHIPDDDVEKLKTLNDFIQYIKNKL